MYEYFIDIYTCRISEMSFHDYKIYWQPLYKVDMENLWQNLKKKKLISFLLSFFIFLFYFFKVPVSWLCCSCNSVSKTRKCPQIRKKTWVCPHHETLVMYAGPYALIPWGLSQKIVSLLVILQDALSFFHISEYF